jgi:phage/plasmid-like protein (TIGR03299 family)
VGRPPRVYQDLAPWQVLNEQSEETESITQALIDYDLDWTVDKVPTYIKNPSGGGWVVVPDRSAIVRSDTQQIIGTAGKLFTPIQNRDAFGQLQIAIDDHGAQVVMGGYLADGAKVYMLLQLLPHGKGEVVPGDVLAPYCLLTNAHTSEKSSTLSARYMADRLWCSNALGATMVNVKASVAIPHHKNIEERAEEIGKLMETMYDIHDKTIKVYRGLAKVKVTQEEIDEFVELVWPRRKVDQKAEAKDLKKLAADIEESEKEDKRNKNDEARENVRWLVDNGKHTGRTAWGVYNAATEYVDHVSILKADGSYRATGPEQAMFGLGAYTKQRALDIALKLWGPNGEA